MKTIFFSVPYFFALLFANWKTHLLSWQRTVGMCLGMIAQNLLFFVLWIVLFKAVDSIKGWHLAQVGLVYSFGAFSVGTTLFFFDGLRTLVTQVTDGTVDSYLCKPRHPLLPILLSRSSAGSLGDIANGLIFWFVFAEEPLRRFPLFLCLAALTTLVFLSTTLIFYSLVFWQKKIGTLPEQFFNMFLIFSVAPQHTQPPFMKMVIYTILPAGFVTLLPSSLVHDFSINTFGLMLVATVFYAALALTVFNKGIDAYRK